MAPALLLIGVIVLFPILYMLYISFTNLNLYHWKNFELVGFENYVKALTRLENGFWIVLLRTILWTVLNLSLQFVFALGISLLLNIPKLRFKGIYKTLLMVSWAVPAYISALIWRNGMFHPKFGILNRILGLMNLDGIPWLSNDFWAFVSCLVVNLWMALPFMILMIFGGLQSIDRTYYEAAEMEGAGFFPRLISVTLPLLKPVLIPVMTLTAFVTFKQFDIVFLMTQRPGGKTGANIHMVITYAYEKAFVTNNYGFSSALSVIIFLIILGLTFLSRKAKKGEVV